MAWNWPANLAGDSGPGPASCAGGHHVWGTRIRDGELDSRSELFIH